MSKVPGFTFNDFLRSGGIDPADVRLLRHGQRHKNVSRYDTWKSDRLRFESYQNHQDIKNEKKLNCRYWASFIAIDANTTIFCGLYEIVRFYRNTENTKNPLDEIEVWQKGSCNKYEAIVVDYFRRFEDNIKIDWGNAPATWIQYAKYQDKPLLRSAETHQIQTSIEPSMGALGKAEPPPKGGGRRSISPSFGPRRGEYKDREAFVYVLRFQGFAPQALLGELVMQPDKKLIKIGWSFHPEHRARQLNRGFPKRDVARREVWLCLPRKSGKHAYRTEQQVLDKLCVAEIPGEFTLATDAEIQAAISEAIASVDSQARS